MNTLEAMKKALHAWENGLGHLARDLLKTAIQQVEKQERETVVCESCGETIPECQIAGETESGGVACTGCVVSYLENRANALENRASAIATAVMTDNQYHDSLLRDRDYLLAVLEEIADDIWSRYGCKKVAEEAIAKVKEGKAKRGIINDNEERH